MAEYLAPGVYMEEIPSGVHSISGVPTSTAAFVGATASGPTNAPVLVHSFAEFQAQFGGLAADMPLGYAVQQYFGNGGREALIARAVPSGAALTDADLSNPALEQQRRGLWLLEHAEQFSILCIPPLTRTTDVGRATWDAAIEYAVRRRAMVIVDPPAAWTSAQVIPEAAVTAVASSSPYAALYYPRLQAPDPLHGNQPATFAPSGAIAGIYARTDAARGVWKAPAGVEATIAGIQGLSAILSEAQLATLNALGVNALRSIPGSGYVVWGARTLGSEVAELRYVPVRRLMLFIEASLLSGLKWAVFEPNGATLWSQVRQSVEDFLHGLWLQGALTGAKPEDAYFVRCDATTMTQDDINNGRLKVLVGVAAVRPAEFVILGIGQWTHDQSQTSFLIRRFGIQLGRYTLAVAWDGKPIPGVIRVRGLGQLTELTTMHDGGAPSSAHVIVGPTKFEPITLERGVTEDNAFEAWAQAMQRTGTPAPRKDVRIELHDGLRGRTIAWRLKGALPVKYVAPDLEAAGNDVAIEQLTLAYEGLERVDPT
jgi:phage tail-like protein